ncbi:hypothetical protein Q1695_003534 [Nippostrongylus brasiliensis]|nr:hypothetical protein Q1695_003534 [Nippostrongylus brasiliensis]
MFTAVIGGVIICILSTLSISLYCPVMYVFGRRQEFRHVVAYQITFWTGVTNIGQLIIHDISGILAICQIEFSIFYFNKFLGSTLYAFWFAMLFLEIITTLNRLVSVVYPAYYSFVFERTKVQIVYVLAFGIFACVWIVKLTPYTSYYFNYRTLRWTYPSTDIMILSRISHYFGTYAILVHVLAAAVVYTVIAVYIYSKKGNSLKGGELVLTLQHFLVSLVFLFGFIYWDFIDVWDRTLVVNFFSNLIWIIINGMNPFIYLLVNRRLRVSLMRLFSRNTKRVERTITVLHAILLSVIVACASSLPYIPAGEDGKSCAATLCEMGMVCVQSVSGAKCVAKDPTNNCDYMNCGPGRMCMYEEEECIPDKACFARPVCQRGGPEPPPYEQYPTMVNNGYRPSPQSDTPPGGLIGGTPASPRCKGRNERYYACKPCESTCTAWVLKQAPSCPNRKCTPGCACIPNWHRKNQPGYWTGTCVRPTWCNPITQTKTVVKTVQPTRTVPGPIAATTCANVRCAAGSTCQMQGGKPTCVAGPNDPCKTTVCTYGSMCRVDGGKAVCVKTNTPAPSGPSYPANRPSNPPPTYNARPSGPAPPSPKPSNPAPARPSYPAPSSPGPARPSYPAPSSPGPARPSYPAPSSPGPARPSYPAPSNPRPSNPSPNQPRPPNPGTNNPRPANPPPYNPRPSNPAPAYPRPSNPGPSYPSPSNPGPAYPRPSPPAQPSYPSPAYPPATQAPYPPSQPAQPPASSQPAYPPSRPSPPTYGQQPAQPPASSQPAYPPSRPSSPTYGQQPAQQPPSTQPGYQPSRPSPPVYGQQPSTAPTGNQPTRPIAPPTYGVQQPNYGQRPVNIGIPGVPVIPTGPFSANGPVAPNPGYRSNEPVYSDPARLGPTKCAVNEVLTQCGGCERQCQAGQPPKPAPVCTRPNPCARQCKCKPGFARVNKVCTSVNLCHTNYRPPVKTVTKTVVKTLPPKTVTSAPAPNKNPCASVNCGAGATCQNSNGRAVCTSPPANPCANVVCVTGKKCQVSNGKGVCVLTGGPAPPSGTPAPPTSAPGTTYSPPAGCTPACGPGLACRNGICYNANRLSDSTGAAQPPCLAKCSANERCVLQSDDNSCYNPPCPARPTCVRIYIQPGHPQNKCAAVLCAPPSVCNVVAGEARCVPPPCKKQCPYGTQCKVTVVQCIRAPCPPIEECIQTPSNDASLKVGSACRMPCPYGETCRVEQVFCKKAPCPPVERCVPVKPSNDAQVYPSKGCTLFCPMGQRCVSQQVQCIRAPCPAQQRCVPMVMADGYYNKLTAVPTPTLSCANVLCAPDSPRCVESPTGPRCVPVKSCTQTVCPDGQHCEQPIPTQDAKCVANTPGPYRDYENQPARPKVACNLLCARGLTCVVTPDGPQCQRLYATSQSLSDSPRVACNLFCMKGLTCVVTPNGPRCQKPYAMNQPLSDIGQGCTPTSCPPNQKCIIQVGKNVVCIPTLTCGTLRCGPETKCYPGDSSTDAQCVPYSTCDTLLCDSNSRCISGNGVADAQCVPIATCANTCIGGTICRKGRCVTSCKQFQCGLSQKCVQADTGATCRSVSTCSQLTCFVGFKCQEGTGNLDARCIPDLAGFVGRNAASADAPRKVRTCNFSCAQGTTCKVTSSGASCVPVKTCDQMTCMKNTKCVQKDPSQASHPDALCLPVARCEVLKCQSGYRCVAGDQDADDQCIPFDTCETTLCPPNTKCVDGNGLANAQCVTDPGCEQTCVGGTRCVGGTCVPTCQVLRCVSGQRCRETDTGAVCSQTKNCADLHCYVGNACIEATDTADAYCAPVGRYRSNDANYHGGRPIPTPTPRYRGQSNVPLPRPNYGKVDHMTSYGDEPGAVQSDATYPTRSTRCRSDEMLNQCGNLCEPKCTDLTDGPRVCPAICGQPACVCKTGLYRSNGKCLTKAQCTGGYHARFAWIRRQRSVTGGNRNSMNSYGDEPVIPLMVCGANEDVNNCGALCEGKCSQLGKVLSCPEVCLPPACACRENFYRNDQGDCVPAKQCNPNQGGSYVDEPVLHCRDDLNEQLDSCGNRCEPTCENAFGMLKVCLLICDPPACVCKSNYYRKDGKCIPQSECPPPTNQKSYVDEPVTPYQTMTPKPNSYVDEPITPSPSKMSSKQGNYVDEPITPPPPKMSSKQGNYVDEPITPPPPKMSSKQNNYVDEPITPPPTKATSKQNYVDEPVTPPPTKRTSKQNNYVDEPITPPPTKETGKGKSYVDEPITPPPVKVTTKGNYVDEPITPRPAPETSKQNNYVDEPITPLPDTNGKKSYVDEPITPSPFKGTSYVDEPITPTTKSYVDEPGTKCSDTETLDNCGNLCEAKCENIGKGPVPCPLVCGPPACACKPGFFRDARGICVTAANCPSKCGRNEQINPCGSRCEPTCENAFGKPKACVKICDPPACVCKPDYYRKDGQCVPQMGCGIPSKPDKTMTSYGDEPQTGGPEPNPCFGFKCPKGEKCSLAGGLPQCVPEQPHQCGEHEKMHSCGRHCESNCANAGKGPVKCERPCTQPACVCDDGYFRNSDGKCVLERMCSLKCAKNEHGSPCGDLCELSCDEELNKEKELPCIEVCAPPACVCDDGYLRLKKGGPCVPEDSCPKISPVNPDSGSNSYRRRTRFQV